MIIYAGIDGTGPWSDKTYKRDFEHSFVNTLHKRWPYPGMSFYHRGPSLLGMETDNLARKVCKFVEKQVDKGKAKGVILAGYSRGGAAVIEAAKYLDGWFTDIFVDGLFLFDAVDRSTEVGGVIFDTPISKTVRKCYHAMRNPRSGSRESFGNCGRRVQDKTKTLLIEKNSFFCTHGGMGGVPWEGKAGVKIDEGWPDNATNITPAQDKIGSTQVKNWMFPRVEGVIRAVKQRVNTGRQVTSKSVF